MTETSENLKRFKACDGNVAATAHKREGDPKVTLSIARHSGERADEMYLEAYASLSPAQAREICAALVQAADFAEGVER